MTNIFNVAYEAWWEAAGCLPDTEVPAMRAYDLRSLDRWLTADPIGYWECCGENSTYGFTIMKVFIGDDGEYAPKKYWDDDIRGWVRSPHETIARLEGNVRTLKQTGIFRPCEFGEWRHGKHVPCEHIATYFVGDTIADGWAGFACDDHAHGKQYRVWSDKPNGVLSETIKSGDGQ